MTTTGSCWATSPGESEQEEAKRWGLGTRVLGRQEAEVQGRVLSQSAVGRTWHGVLSRGVPGAAFAGTWGHWAGGLLAAFAAPQFIKHLR